MKQNDILEYWLCEDRNGNEYTTVTTIYQCRPLSAKQEINKEEYDRRTGTQKSVYDWRLK